MTSDWEHMQQKDIKLEKAGQVVTKRVRMAANAAERAAGYQWICAADAMDTAVLFVFANTIHSSFHMRNVIVPIDIHFFNEAGQQVDALVMRPEPPGKGLRPQYYQPVASFRYALEIARSQTHDLGSTPLPIRLLVDSL